MISVQADGFQEKCLTYDVQIVRHYYTVATVQVRAHSSQEAEEIALKKNLQSELKVGDVEVDILLPNN